jgi:D-alanine-D-alanine ligase
MKRNIAIVAGGDSGEYEISMKSGRVVFETIDREKFHPFLIHVRGSEWFSEINGKKFLINKNDFSLTMEDQTITFECVFCAIHGSPGENGKLPAYFEMLRIPYTSCDSAVSALTFNKNLCNKVVASWGVNVSPSMHFFKGSAEIISQILKSLRVPLFVKPNGSGSSVGMSKVNKAEELTTAIEKAFAEDTEILVEQFIKGREFTCGVLEVNNHLTVFPICEIKSKKEYFDYEAKYDPNLAEEILPADIPANLETTIKETSAFLFKKLNCKGVVRFDYIYSEDENIIYFLEVNTVPGLTHQSIVPKMAAKVNISTTELFSMMIEDAIWRSGQLKS